MTRNANPALATPGNNGSLDAVLFPERALQRFRIAGPKWPHAERAAYAQLITRSVMVRLAESPHPTNYMQLVLGKVKPSEALSTRMKHFITQTIE